MVATLLQTSCKKTKKEEKEAVREVAKEFLNDFYYKDFTRAEKFANKNTKSFFKYIENNDQEEYRHGYFNSIDSIILKGKEMDSAFVYYRYENSYYKKDNHVLPLLKIQGQWIVNIENKDNLDFYRLVFDYSSVEVNSRNYFELSDEEINEIELFTNTFIKQINHPKLVVGMLSSSSIDYYDIEGIENFSNYNSYYWSELETMSVNSHFNFNSENILYNFQYVISNIKNKNGLGVFEQIESILIQNYGMPFNRKSMNEDKWYKSLRWFMKGGNEIVELINNEDNSITLQVIASEGI